MTPRDVRDYLLEEGFRAKLDESEEDCSTIESADEGLLYQIHFYRPTPPDGDVDAFESISFSTGREYEGEVPLSVLNEYNARYRFTKIYHQKGALYLEMDNIIFPNNLTPDLFEDILGFWTVSLVDFVKIAE